MKICSIEGCESKALAKSYCSKHYQRFKRHGDANFVEFEVKVRRAVDHGDGTRTCPECGIRKTLEEFHKDRNAPSGYRARCAKCHTEYSKKWYEKNQPAQKDKATQRRIKFSDRIRKQDSERYERTKPRRLELASKHSQIRRARKANAEFDSGISKKSLRKLLGENCHYCGIQMDFSGTTKALGYKDAHATIEHVIPLSKGGTHTWGNVVLACRKCNITKHNKTKLEWEEFKNKSN